MTKRRMTLADIAAEAGVSKATVSRVLSNSNKVKATSKERILRIIEKHSYVPNRIAQSLAGTPQKTVGIVIDELANFFFIEVADGFDQIIGREGYSMQISSSRWDEAKELTLVRHLISGRMDGIILAPISGDSESIRLLQSSGIPFLIINTIPREKGVAFVSCNNYRGGTLVAELVNRINRPRTILVSGFPHQSLSQRVAGFIDNLERPGDLVHYPHINTYEEGYEIASVMLVKNSLSKGQTIIFGTNDNVAIGIITRLVELGVSIPQQVAVIGYDNIKLSSFCRIPLTTVSQQIRDIGKLAALELLDMIRNPDRAVPEHTIEPHLVIRESARLD